ncbi:MAG: creatininase family protein [Proteobacteria bacterium]|nr:creatininase family protein [Pseudomonadota bacterium]NIS70791.1 creatininase family protein [Pseudomonadota bacterium]
MASRAKSGSKVWLQEMRWQEVEKLRNSGVGLAVIPVGSVEQHGFHLPAGTDSMVAIRLAEDAAQRTGVLVTPPLWFGWSPHHLAYPGTISIRPDVLSEILFDIVSSLATQGFNRFVIVNGHRIANIPWIQISAERAQRELGVRVLIYDPAYMSKEIADRLGFGKVGHAEEIETSHMLHIMPNLVRMEKARDYIPPERKLYHVDPRIPKDTVCYVPGTAKNLEQAAKDSGGGHGRPSLATAEKGSELHEHLVGRLIEVINELNGARND